MPPSMQQALDCVRRLKRLVRDKDRADEVMNRLFRRALAALEDSNLSVGPEECCSGEGAATLMMTVADAMRTLASGEEFENDFNLG